MPNTSEALIGPAAADSMTDQEKAKLCDALLRSLADPETVLVGMMRGYIAKLSARGIANVFGEVVNCPDGQILEIARLRAELQEVRKNVSPDLRNRCVELLNLQNTGVLCGTALKAFAASRSYAGELGALSIAAAETAREAYEVIAAGCPAIGKEA